MIHILSGLILFLFVAVTPASAYLDPGTGSYIIQILIGFLVGGLYMAKVYWAQLKTFITTLVDKKKKTSETKKH